MASPELQALMAQMRDFFAAMMQQQQTAMEAMLNNELRQASGSGAGYQREVLQESGELQRRAGVARLVVPIQVSDQDGPRSSVQLDCNGEKEEKEIDDVLSLSEEERSLSSGIFNILGT